MAYPYGTQGAPAVGAGAPGLPQRGSTIGADPLGPPLQTILVRTSSSYAVTPFITPDWATFARVTAIGKGGRGLGGTSGLSVSGTGFHGGGGAGCSGTNLETISPGTPISISFDADAVRVAVLAYQLVAGNGNDASNVGNGSGGAGGIASGGAINFSGGSGGNASSGSGGGGGGAGGRGGAGSSAGSSSNGGNGGLGDAYTTGGGAGGAGNSSGVGNAVGGLVRTDASQIGSVLLGQSSTTNAVGAAAANSNGGDLGGGSGGSNSSINPNVPGSAGVLIELW